MAISDKLQELLDIKQDIKEAIENKNVDMTGVDFNGYAAKIDEIQTGGEGMTYEDYARTLYLGWGKSNQFATAWEHSLIVNPSEISANSTTSNNRGKAQYPNGDTEGVIIPQGVTSIGQYSFYKWSANNRPLVIPNSVTSIEIYAFQNWSANNRPLVIPDSVESIANFAFQGWSANNQPLVISNTATSIGLFAFSNWTSNNQPLVIPDSVTSIQNAAFQNWSANNRPLVIPSGITSIGTSTFSGWTSNTHPIVIPSNVSSIGSFAFSKWPLVPYVEMKGTTPPTLANVNAFNDQNNAPIYVSDASVTAYKTATNWVSLANRIFPISDK